VRTFHSRVGLIAAAALLVPLIAVSQRRAEELVLAGYSGSVPVIQMNGKSYVEVVALARMAGGSVSFDGNRETLTLPAETSKPSAAMGPAPSTATPGFSRDFLRAAVEEMRAFRQWHATLQTTIENQFPMAQAPLAPEQAEVVTDVRLVEVAATTDADRGAARMIANAYQKMKSLNDKYAEQSAALTYIPRDSLATDTLNQSVVVCSQSLAAIAAGGQLVDDGACN
jgi:hypothetical protein